MICTVHSFPLIIREDHSWTPAAFDSVQTDLSFLHRLSIVQVLGIKGLSENVYSSMDGKGRSGGGGGVKLCFYINVYHVMFQY